MVPILFTKILDMDRYHYSVLVNNKGQIYSNSTDFIKFIVLTFTFVDMAPDSYLFYKFKLDLFVIFKQFIIVTSTYIVLNLIMLAILRWKLVFIAI